MSSIFVLELIWVRRTMFGGKQSETHISPGGGDEVQAVLFYIICDAKCQVQHFLRVNTGKYKPVGGEDKQNLKRLGSC